MLSSRMKGEGRQAYDLDEKWSNLYREREKNHLYKWVGVRKGLSHFIFISQHFFSTLFHITTS